MYKTHGQDKISSPYVSQGGNNFCECLILSEDDCCVNILDMQLKRWAGSKQGEAAIPVKAITASVQFPTYQWYSQMLTDHY